MPPARKRRKIERKDRTTQHLDLTSDTAQSQYDRSEALDLLLKALRKRRKIVVVAGAGISVSAGIPDFRSADGLFRTLRDEHKLKGSGKELFDASVYKDNSSTSSFHDMVRELSKVCDSAKPTLFHRLVARLAKENRLLRLYTQNVDGLENDLEPLKTETPLSHKAPWPRTIQVHGGLEKMVCQKCRHISDFQPHLFEGPDPPPCPECVLHDALRTTHAGKRSHGVGKLRPRMVLYNEQNPDDEAIGAVATADFRTRPDAVIVVGTSMKIPTVRRIVHEMCRIVRDRKEGTAIWINLDAAPTGKDLEDCWDLVVKGDCDEVARLAAFREWDDDTPEVAEIYTDSDIEKIKSSQGEIKVMIPSTPKKQVPAETNLGTQAMTPPLSPRPVPSQTTIHQDGSPRPKIMVRIPNPHKLIGSSLKNPASAGRPLSYVFGSMGTQNIQSKPKTSLNKKTSKPSKPELSISRVQSKLMGQVRKAGVQSPIVVAKDAVKPLAPRRSSDANAMPPNYQHRLNGTSFKVETSPFSGINDGLMSETPPNADSRSRTPSPDVTKLSPKEYVPADMRKLLH